MAHTNIYQKARSVKLLISDVDGVLTDGSIIYDAAGSETKVFDARDGMIIVALLNAGIKVAILSGRNSKVVDIRARELGIPIVRQGAIRKLEVLQSILEEVGVTAEETAFIGDDVNDVTVLRAVGLAFSPANGVAQAREVADYVTRAGGGHGAVREIGEMILEAQGLREQWLQRYDL
jgi:3-deoxy-D-manno-octulosonate 8-phosphate phosphatase (KDO 8-P phosphatase)